MGREQFTIKKEQNTVLGMARILSARFPTSGRMQETLQTAQERIHTLESTFRLEKYNVADAIVNSFERSDIGLIHSIAELIITDHPLVEGWNDLDRAYFLETALSKEIAQCQEKIHKLERIETYYGYDEDIDMVDELKVSQTDLHRLQRYQRMMRHAVIANNDNLQLEHSQG